jgi:hypothetical protein
MILLKYKIYFISTFILLICYQCKQTKIGTKESKLAEIASKSQTAFLITKEDDEKFFFKLQAIDVAVQLKNNSFLNNKNYLADYRAFLKSQALEFSKAEAESMASIMNEVYTDLKTINPKFLVPVSICKIDVGHYGSNVFYTRGNAIFIPQNVLNPIDKASLKRVLFHEMWHILSEAFPDLKTKLYGTIGFEKNTSSIKYPPLLKKRLLTNPDGAHDNYFLTLKGKKVLPIILSKHDSYKSEIPEFTSYIQFELYNINENGEVETNQDMTTTVSTDQYNDFFANIKDNTDYIIHPDEIIADNFVLAVTNDNKMLSTDGKKLFGVVQEILKKW